MISEYLIYLFRNYAYSASIILISLITDSDLIDETLLSLLYLKLLFIYSDALKEFF